MVWDAEVKEGPRPYKVGGTTTSLMLVLKQGRSTRPFRMEFISNSRASEVCDLAVILFFSFCFFDFLESV